MPHVAELGTDRFRHKSWRFENRPTSETVGILPHPDTDVEAMVAHSTIRQPITVPRIWLARYPATSGQLFAHVTWPDWI